MFERFTAPARESVVLAQHEARRLHHHYIGTEHLLLGLLGVQGDVAARALSRLDIDIDTVRADVVRLIGRGEPAHDRDAEALRTLGIDLDEVRRAVEEEFGPGALEAPTSCRRGRTGGQFGHIPFVARAKKVLELALREAVRMKTGSIGTEHILLAILREGEGVAARILAEHGASPKAVRSAVDEEREDPEGLNGTPA
jgi:ATP-dependent Clp protease ATP-binding subunit ClpA